MNEGEEYDKISSRVVGVGENSKILIIKRSEKAITGAGKWDIPGGRVDERDRSLERAAQRELFEETNIFCPEEDLIYIDRDDW